MGKTLPGALKGVAVVLLVSNLVAVEAKAYPVECAGCVAAINSTTTAVESGNSELAAIKAELTVIKNYLNQIKLSLGSVSTTATVGTFAQSSDVLNFGQHGPRLDKIDFGKGVEIQLDSLQDLSKTLNSTLGLVNDAKAVKDAAKSGNLLVTVEELKNISRRRHDLLRSSVGRVLETGVYTLGQTSVAKGREVSLDQTRRHAGDVQSKAGALMEQNQEILSRLNTLIVLMAEQSTLLGAKELQTMPRPRGPEPEGGSAPPPAKNVNSPWSKQ